MRLIGGRTAADRFATRGRERRGRIDAPFKSRSVADSRRLNVRGERRPATTERAGQVDLTGALANELGSCLAAPIQD